MKNYTDIEQSKKLAEILPIESADMEYLAIKENGKLIGNIPFVKDDSEVEDSAYSQIYDRFACWSLTSLLDILPKEYTNSKNQVCTLHIDIVDSETPYLMWYANPEHEGSIVEMKTKEYSNLIDACYEMIVWLLENGCIKKGDSV